METMAVEGRITLPEKGNAKVITLKRGAVLRDDAK